MGIICSPYLLFPNKYLINPIKIWIIGIIKILYLTCNINYEIRGLNNIPKKGFIIASKHQSAFETFIFFLYLKNPIFIHKKQLFYIPIFGQYLKKINMISINRSQGTKAMRTILKKTKEKINSGNSIIIFPEGTRKKPGDEPNYKSGIFGIYREAGVEIIPVALNSGLYWPKHTFVKNSGNIIIEFLNPIPPNLEKSALLEQIEKTIELNSKKLI
tara:strand:- start:809 stop:1453 length:645 start_codon:yes stop_codon:yes gene_type:complete